MKELRDTYLSDKDKKRMTISYLTDKLPRILVDCIGKEKAIPKEELFKRVYGRKYQDKIKEWIMWDFVVKAMTKLRKTGYCFPISVVAEGNTYYYIPTSEEERKPYEDMIKSRISAMKYMIKRSKKAVDEEWHKKLEKELEGKRPKALK